MIRIQGLYKKYETKTSSFCALKNIDLSISDGESVAIMGKSGAGKTTLLNIIGCLDNFDAGECYMDAQNIGAMNPNALAKLRNDTIGFVMQDFALVAYKTALFNVTLPMYFDRTPMRDMKRAALDALAKVDLSDLADQRINTLSGGEKQRVAIARAIVKRPGLILADEPTGSLDSKTGAAIMGLLMEMNRSGMTLIVVTHDEDVANYCRRRIVLHDGEIISDKQQSA